MNTFKLVIGSILNGVGKQYVFFTYLLTVELKELPLDLSIIIRYNPDSISDVSAVQCIGIESFLLIKVFHL